MRGAFLVVAIAASWMFAFANELETAREALRDGLWDVARTHAATTNCNEALAITAESYARENKWAELLATLKGEDDDGSGIFCYYRALAYYKTGKTKDAISELDDITSPDASLESLCTVLRATIAMETGKSEEKTKAVALIKNIDFKTASDDARMIAAEIMEANGDRKDAIKIWHSIVNSTNANEKAFVVAAINLEDVNALRNAYQSAKDPGLRRMSALQLGVQLIKDKSTFAEGAELISDIVGESPDQGGAKEAMIALADAYLTATNYVAASEKYRQTLEIWPEAASMSEVHEAHGWALRQLGKREEAIECYKRAEEVAKDDTAKASAMLAHGDTLSELGRGEEAMELYREVKKKYPQTPAGEKLKGIISRRENESAGIKLYSDFRFEEARKVFAKLAEEDPSVASRMAYFDMLCLYGLGRDEEAWRKACEISSESDDVMLRNEATLWKAKYAYNRRRWGEAAKLFKQYVEMAPESKYAPSALAWAARAAFAESDYPMAIEIATALVKEYPASPEKAKGYLIQGEALIELARFDEAVLVLERMIVAEGTPAAERLRAQLAKADALFAMGADNPRRYDEALEAYSAIRRGEALSPSARLMVSFKLARTLEKLKRPDEAIDRYYTDVVLAYRDGRRKGLWFDDEARATFARAAFRLADEYEARGKDFQAMHILELVVASDTQASDEAEKRIDRIQTKGRLL